MCLSSRGVWGEEEDGEKEKKKKRKKKKKEKKKKRRRKGLKRKRKKHEEYLHTYTEVTSSERKIFTFRSKQNKRIGSIS